MTRSTYEFQPRDSPRDTRVVRSGLTEAEQLALWEAELPPSEVWLVNPGTDQFETPTDNRGLVDIKALITLGKTAVVDGYAWDISRTRDDHLYWPETAFRKLAWKLDNPLPVTFRNIPPNIIRLPLEFERWKHAITVPPDFPSLEAMDYYVQAWVTARDLYMSVSEAVFWERMHRKRAAGLRDGTSAARPRDAEDRISQEFIVATLADHFRGAAKSLEQHQKLPPEFQFVNPADNARQILRLIGYQVKHRCRDGLRSRYSMFKPLAAA